MIPYITKSPLLFLIFNRPDVTNIVFQAIREAQPKQLYIAADGPRESRVGESELCLQAKDIVSKVDWDCDVKMLYRKENLGCKYAVSSGIDWFFSHVNEGIILEDDCLPSNDFFRFCDEMLEKYRNDTRIRFIGGSNFQNNNSPTKESYYFSNLSHVWGWASWKRTWDSYDVELKHYTNEDFHTIFSNVFGNKLLAADWTEIVLKLINNQIDTWDYQMSITNILNNGLSVIPHKNLISNIGFGQNATHTIKTNGFENLQHQQLETQIIHPNVMVPARQFDLKTMYVEHNILKREQRIRKYQLIAKLKFWT